MKLLEKVKEIVDSYDLQSGLPDIGEHRNIYRYLADSETEREKYESSLSDYDLCDKYSKHIPQGWYGFSIGTPVLPTWIEIIDKVLELCTATDPNFEIHQIKMKFGGIRFYTYSEVIEDLNAIEALLENTMYHKMFVY